ncbi:methionine ABC transporter ATP-binding protein [Vibrio albus]|uniref:Methionine ABC transporter ATP-binding protein n=1 Tax=Vibrio albus TaxID=2200953 RepID=A0A2U3BA37_9VIBR|nr:ABC transporter ATP-binding protein [Vibrio albus]PWI33637.1 methionine ABC transporter ATP-binding protein [Vibrio albus]
MDSLSDKSEHIVTLSDISFAWRQAQAPVLSFSQLNIKHNEHVFIKGPSGSGKSTLLGLLTGILSPQEGQVSILNTELNQLKQNQRDRFRADHIGYIFQQFNLLPYLSVIDNVILPCHFSVPRKNKAGHAPKSTAIKLLKRLRLDDTLLYKPVVELSIGQQQRVAAARALMGHPEILIADEPTSALDQDNRTAFIELLMEEVRQSNSTLIFVSHDASLENLFTRTINLTDLNRGQAADKGEPYES